MLTRLFSGPFQTYVLVLAPRALFKVVRGVLSLLLVLSLALHVIGA